MIIDFQIPEGPNERDSLGKISEFVHFTKKQGFRFSTLESAKIKAVFCVKIR